MLAVQLKVQVVMVLGYNQMKVGMKEMKKEGKLKVVFYLGEPRRVRAS